MSVIEEVLDRVTTITYDCYGTLIDWRAGLGRSLSMLLGAGMADRTDEIYETYVRVEAEVEAGGYQPYRRVLAAAAERLGRQLRVELPPGRASLLAEVLPDWPLFADTNEALVRLKQRYRLGVLSNIDRDLFAGTAQHFDVEFDFVVTAQDVRAYKPAHGHFERLLLAHGERDQVLHVAQSLFHDGAPTRELGIAFVWINRYNDVNRTEVRPLAMYPDLKSLADVACGV